MAKLKFKSGFNLAYNTHTTVAASDTVVTGLTKVVAAFATLDSDPIAAVDRVLASVGDQVSAPVAGSILIKTFKPTATADTAPIAATTFGRKVSWYAIGF